VQRITAIVSLLSAPLLARALGSRPARSAGEPTDEELVGRARRGDPGAMQAIYQRHADLVYRRLTHLVGPDPEREDLLQEVFIALFASIGSFRGDASLRTYLCRIVAHKAYDHLKRRRRTAGTRSLDDAPGELGEVESDAPSPERLAQGHQDAEVLWRCLDGIKPKKRIAFVLRVVEGHSLKEISQQVGASVHTVAQRIRHAKLELLELVREQRARGDDR
jgi:RNA polymerase sigma-70 factor (ECF subfamily)